MEKSSTFGAGMELMEDIGTITCMETTQNMSKALKRKVTVQQ